MYSNQSPRVHELFTREIPDDCYSYPLKGSNDRYLSTTNINEYLVNLLKPKSFDVCPLDTDFQPRYRDENFALLVGQNGQKSVIILIEDDFRLDCSLMRVECEIHPSVFASDKWNYPEKLRHYEERCAFVNEMSWRFIDCLIHYKNTFHDIEGSFYEGSPAHSILFEKIRRDGFENSIIRVVSVFSDSGHYKMNLLYDKFINDEDIFFLSSIFQIDRNYPLLDNQF